MRNLVKLNRVAPNAKYRSFAVLNANSILNNDVGSNNQLGALWEGPSDSGDGTRQASALDALIAVMEMQ